MFCYFLKIGALTSKPYAFTARSWELKSYDSLDFFDGLGNSIRLDVRGSDVMRVLPKRTDRVNEEWISDKVRFMYDALKRQRLQKPFFRVWESFSSRLLSKTWEEIFAKLHTLFLSVDRETVHFDFVCGPFADLETLSVAKRFFSNFSHTVRSSSDPILSSVDFRSDYIFNASLVDIEKSDCIFLCGTNIRYEYPTVNLRLRKAVNQNNAFVGVFGYNHNLTYEAFSFGSSSEGFYNFLAGKNLAALVFSRAQFPAIIIGKDFVYNNSISTDYSSLSSFVRFLNSKASLSVLSTAISTVCLSDIGFTSSSSILDCSKVNVLYLLGSDYKLGVQGFYDNFDYDFVIYQGHHGDASASLADIILPSVLPYEKTATFSTILGDFVKSKFVLTPVGDVRVDWRIFNALSLLLVGKNIADSYDLVLEQVLAAFTPYASFHSVATSFPPRESRFYFNNEIVSSSMDDFYLTDSLTRNSLILALSSSRMRKVSTIWY